MSQRNPQETAFHPERLERFTPEKAIRFIEYTPIIDGHEHGYHVATIDLGHAETAAQYDVRRGDGSVQHRMDLVAQAIEVTKTLFETRGGRISLIKDVDTLENTPASAQSGLSRSCIRLYIIGTFGGSVSSRSQRIL